MTAIPLICIEAQDEVVACTLAPSEFRNRTQELAGVAARALISRHAIEGGERLTFADTAEVERELREAVTAESSCCTFLAMSLTRTSEGLVLDVTGPAQAKPIIAELFA